MVNIIWFLVLQGKRKIVNSYNAIVVMNNEKIRARSNSSRTSKTKMIKYCQSVNYTLKHTTGNTDNNYRFCRNLLN
jgi:hypothetical protein